MEISRVGLVIIFLFTKYRILRLGLKQFRQNKTKLKNSGRSCIWIENLPLNSIWARAAKACFLKRRM